MDPRTPPSTPRQNDETPPHQHVATPHAASPATAMAAQQYNETINAVASITLSSPKKSKVYAPRSCRSVWQAHGGGMVAPHLSTKKRCSDIPSNVFNYEPAISRNKRGRSPPHLDRNSKLRSE